LARFREYATNLTLGIVGHFLQPVVGNVGFDNAASPLLTGFDLSAQ
jgi:hypothetical protein